MIKYLPSPEIKLRVDSLINSLGLNYIDSSRVLCFRSDNTKSKLVHARCHGLSRIFQHALNCEPYYIIEVIGKTYDRLSDVERDKLLIHELLHIPQTFSGALKNHKGSAHKELVTKSVVNNVYSKLINDESLDLSRRKNRVSVDYFPAVSIKERLSKIIYVLDWNHIKLDRVSCLESKGSSINRPLIIGKVPRIWRKALGIKSHYIIEVLSERFNKLSPAEQDIALINLLLYIPKRFNGSISRGVSSFDVRKYYNLFKERL